MSVHEDLLNNGENNCSFTEDEVDIMCSKDAYGACGDCVLTLEEMPILSGFVAYFEGNISTKIGLKICACIEKLNTDKDAVKPADKRIKSGKYVKS